MKNRIQQLLQSMKEQEWYQQLQSAYQQLSPDQQKAAKWGGLATVMLLGLYFTWNVVAHSNAVKNEYFQKQQLMMSLNQASEEIRRLKGQNVGMNQSSSADWRTLLQNLATAQGLPVDSVELIKEGSNSAMKGVIQETLLEVRFKSVALQPLVQILYQMEHSQPPIKLKGMLVEPSTTEGLLNAKLNLSGYLAKGEKSK